MINFSNIFNDLTMIFYTSSVSQHKKDDTNSKITFLYLLTSLSGSINLLLGGK